MAQKLTPGDMVEWSGWWIDHTGNIKHEVYIGVLIDIFSETLCNRDVLYGRILPINNSIIFEVNVFCLRKVSEKETN